MHLNSQKFCGSYTPDSNKKGRENEGMGRSEEREIEGQESGPLTFWKPPPPLGTLIKLMID
jgi:hypothetical protein